MFNRFSIPVLMLLASAYGVCSNETSIPITLPVQVRIDSKPIFSVSAAISVPRDGITQSALIQEIYRIVLSHPSLPTDAKLLHIQLYKDGIKPNNISQAQKLLSPKFLLNQAANIVFEFKIKPTEKETVSIEVPGGQRYTIEYGPNDTIDDVIRELRKKSGVGHKYTLKLFSQPLDPRASAQTLKKAGKLYAADFAD